MIGQTLGNYKIAAKLGNGSMGDVFLADHQRIARRAAIKILNQELTTKPQQVARFFDEARATSLIRHPGIVEVFDCDVDPQGRVYLVMEYLEGQTLAARLEPERRLPWPIACALARQVANALGAAHEKGIVHRDIKPENIFLSASPASPIGMTVKILDFGIAKLLDKDLGSAYRTVPGLVLGTPHYMPPEQCDGAESLGPQADIYALGCVLFRMITGRLPFVGSQMGEVLAAQTFRPPPPLGPVDPPAPAWLEALVAGMLAKQASDRPASMREVARMLDRASAGRHVAGVLRHAGSSLVSRFAALVGLSGSVRDRPRLVGMVAGFCAVMIGGGLWEARAILQHEKPTAASRSPAQDLRRQNQPRSNAAGVAQSPVPAAAAGAATPLPNPAPAIADKAVTRDPLDAATGAGGADGAAPAVRRPTSKARLAGRDPAVRRPSQARVEMDGLVDL